MNKGIYILASERSGTNLLRTLIGNHNKISAPVSPHLLDYFYSKLRYYGDLTNPVNAKDLINDALLIVNHPYHNWELNVDADYILSNYDTSSLFRIEAALFCEKAKTENKEIYCSKGIHNHNFTEYLTKDISEVKFIYLFRDPRDHVASWLRTPLFMHTPFQIVSKWNSEQDICVNKTFIYKDNLLSISYENLISKTEYEMSRIMDFLDVDIDPNCFTTDKNNVESKGNEFWKNLDKPILKNNTKKYKKKLNNQELLIIESVAKKNMLFLGYDDFETSADWKDFTLFFKMRELYRDRISKKKNKKFFIEKMSELKSKIAMQEDIFSNRRTKRNLI